jgi:cell division protein FtsQ
MRRRQTKSMKKSTVWRRTGNTSRRKNAGTRNFGGIGRIVLGVLIVWVFVQFAVRPAVGHLTNHPIFTVREVVVTGVEYLDTEEIRHMAESELGRNIFEVDVAPIAECLNALYEAEDFTVYKCLPGTITIRIHERQPVALLNLQTLVGVDENGIPLPHIGADMVETLPIVTGIISIAALNDSTVHERLVVGLRLLDEMREMAPSTYRRISEVDVSNLNTLGINLIGSGLEVIIGDENWVRKLPVLDRIITEVTYRKEKVKAVDIRLGETIFVQ